MKLYAVTKGEYSDYHIIALTSDKNAAEAIAKKFSSNWREAEVEEYEDASLDFYQKKAFCVRFDTNGNVSDIADWSEDEYSYEEKISVYAGIVDVTIVADNVEQAVKAAAERRAKFLAQKEGL